MAARTAIERDSISLISDAGSGTAEKPAHSCGSLRPRDRSRPPLAGIRRGVRRRSGWRPGRIVVRHRAWNRGRPTGRRRGPHRRDRPPRLPHRGRRLPPVRPGGRLGRGCADRPAGEAAYARRRSDRGDRSQTGPSTEGRGPQEGARAQGAPHRHRRQGRRRGAQPRPYRRRRRDRRRSDRLPPRPRGFALPGQPRRLLCRSRERPARGGGRRRPRRLHRARSHPGGDHVRGRAHERVRPRAPTSRSSST